MQIINTADRRTGLRPFLSRHSKNDGIHPESIADSTSSVRSPQKKHSIDMVMPSGLEVKQSTGKVPAGGAGNVYDTVLKTVFSSSAEGFREFENIVPSFRVPALQSGYSRLRFPAIRRKITARISSNPAKRQTRKCAPRPFVAPGTLQNRMAVSRVIPKSQRTRNGTDCRDCVNVRDNDRF